MIYFWGMHLRIAEKRGIFVLLEKRYKQLKHQYCLKQVQFCEDMSPAAFAEKIVGLYTDKRYALRKRLYSQDRRPARSVLSPPHLVAFLSSASDVAVLNDIRAAGAAVDVVVPSDGKDWHKVEFGRALGHDYHVPEKRLVKCLADVYHSGRLSLSDGDTVSPREFSEDLDLLESGKASYKEGRAHSGAHVLYAIAAPVWFRENVPYNRSYCSR